MNKTNIFAMITGILIGSTLCGAAHAAEGWFKAAPSAQTFWIGGRPVDLEAYVINGNNYVKLRDVGQVVGFEVNYDAATNRVLIGNRTAEPDCTVQVSPAIFTDTLTEGVYNGIRNSIVHREEILAGNYEPIPLKGADSPDDLVSLAITIGMWPNYCFTRNEAGDVVCRSRYAPAFQSAADHCRPFIDSLAGLSDREKVRRIDFYVCDRMTYAPRNAGIDDILTQDGVVSSYCMNYAYCFKFLCDMADIPCILVGSDTHMWNEVYVEGQWWSVDVTGDDCGDEVAIRDMLKILHTAEDIQGAIYADAQPQITAFAKELLVPGSVR